MPTLTRRLSLQDPHMQGEDVKAAQQRLLDLGYRQVGAADGIFGPNTDASVRSFQLLNDITVDGIVGPQSWERLFSSAATPASAVTPVVESDTGWLLGGSHAGKWLDGPTTAQLLRGQERYRLYSFTRAVGMAVGSKPAPLDFGPCETTSEVALAPSPVVSETIAVGGSWEALPRVIAEADPLALVYEQAIVDLLKTHGITATEANVTRVVQVDLEGDGTDEAIILASRNIPVEGSIASVTAGDYSLVVLRKVVNGTMQTISIIADYYPETQTFAAPYEYKLLGLLDLNGDGQLEIIIHGAYYEGAATEAFSIAGTQAQQVLGAGCGV
jgi:hypothetical protein